MSNIYIQEPPTNGKVCLKTSVGDIDIELWSKEAPKACRNFVQLCMENYYNNTIFHRIIKGFIGQGGDPTGTGLGGESVFGEPFKDEFHSRLRFCRRGLVAMANGEKDSNLSQFFFTFGSTPELQNKHTIFGKVTGKTLYNMLKLEESQVDKHDRPLYPHKIISTEIVSNPFDDIAPREAEKKKDVKKEEKVKSKGTKDYKLLSFGDEAEEDEEEIEKMSEGFKGKSKSSHDLLKSDPKLSSIPAIDPSELSSFKSKSKYSSDDNDDNDDNDEYDFKKKSNKSKRGKNNNQKLEKDPSTYQCVEPLDNEEVKLEANKLDEIRKEIKSLQKELSSSSKSKSSKEENKTKKSINPAVAEFKDKNLQYRSTSQLLPKGNERAQQTLKMLAKFQSMIGEQKLKKSGQKESSDGNAKDDQSWLAHELNCQKEDDPVLAKDANMRNEEDWFDIYDPRNPINKRRREEGSVNDKLKKRKD